MYRLLCRNGVYLCSAVFAPSAVKSVAEEKEETGWDRAVKIFKLDEFGEVSPEFSNIYYTTVTTAFFGAMYGGFIYSRDAYFKFIENNEATRFTDHFEAKRQLQDRVTTSFFRGALKWSWRLALFGGMYVTIVSVSGAYRGSPSLLDYFIAGCVSGSLYRVNYGLYGMIAGGTVGSLIGLLAGSCTLLAMRFGGVDHDQVNEWHKGMMNLRERQVKEAMEKSVFPESDRAMLSEHDKRINVS